MKENCVTKELVDIQYPEPSEEVENKIKDNEEMKRKRMRKRPFQILDQIFMKEQAYTSVGRDLEVFHKRIKFGEITKETFPDADKEDKVSKLFCLLSNDERKKLDRKDKNFYETFFNSDFPDVSPSRWKKTESKHLKFASYTAWRRTAFVDTDSKPDDPLIGLIGDPLENQPIFNYFNLSWDESGDESWDESSGDESY